jgi:hypothetical protein
MTTTFSYILYDILANSSHTGIIQWNHLGTRVLILDNKKYVTEVMPLYFDMKHYYDFVHQLYSHSYFVQIEENITLFSHKHFRKDFPSGLRYIKAHPIDIKNLTEHMEILRNQRLLLEDKIEKKQQLIKNHKSIIERQNLLLKEIKSNISMMNACISHRP